jgi:hypothetical protein
MPRPASLGPLSETSDVKYAFEDGDDSRAAEIHATNGSVLGSFVTDAAGLVAVRRSGATSYQYFNCHGDLVQAADEIGVPQNGA